MDNWAVAMLGEGSVGKSALVQQVCTLHYTSYSDIGVAYNTHFIQLVMESFVGMPCSISNPLQDSH